MNGEMIKDNESITIDEIPTVEVTYSNEGNWTNADVTVTIKASEPIEEIPGWTKVDEQTFTKIYADNEHEDVEVKDRTGNLVKVIVSVKNIDKQAPEIRGVSDITLVQGEKFDPLKEIYAYDYQCGEIKEIQVTPSIDTNVVGVYKLEYSASDLAGNVTKVGRTVTVKSKSAAPNQDPNPGKPNANKPNNGKGAAVTGDQSDIGLYVSLLAMSVFGIAALVSWKKKRAL